MNLIKRVKEPQVLALLTAGLTITAFCLLIILGAINGGYDPNFHMARIHTLSNNLRAGHFPNPIGFEYLGGMGYGVGFFYGNFWLYPFAVLNLLGVPLTIVYKLLLVVLVSGAIAAIYQTVKSFTKSSLAATIAMPLYVLNNYYISAAFGRAAIGELFAFVFVPLAFLFTIKIVSGQGEKNYLKLGMTMAALLVSHLLTFMLVIFAVVLILLCNVITFSKNPRRLIELVKAALVGLGLAAVYLLPMLEQFFAQKFLDTTTNDTGTLMLPFSSLRISQAISPRSIFVLHQGYAGPLLVVLTIISIVYCLLRYNKIDKVVGSLIGVVLVLSIPLYSRTVAQFLSTHVPVINTLQSLWRLNVILIPLSLIVVGFFFAAVTNGSKKGSQYSCVIIAILIMISFAATSQTTLKFVVLRSQINKVDFANNYGISRGEYLPVNFPVNYNKHTVTAQTVAASENGIRLVENTHRQMKLRVDAGVTTVKVPKVFYQGYVYRVQSGTGDTKFKAVRKGHDGLGLVKLSQHTSPVLLIISYRLTMAMWAGWIILGSTIIILLYLAIRKKSSSK